MILHFGCTNIIFMSVIPSFYLEQIRKKCDRFKSLLISLSMKDKILMNSVPHQKSESTTVFLLQFKHKITDNILLAQEL